MGAKVSRRTDPYAMVLRRILLLALAGAPLTACNTVQSEPPKLAAVAANDSAVSLMSKLPDAPHQSLPIEQPKRPPHLARQIVAYEGGELPGTVLVRTSERRLYLVLEGGRAIRYPVGVGKYGAQWKGRAQIDGKHVEPAWSPPAVIKHDSPSVPDLIPGGTPGNPMGARALTLSGGGQYAIHGTNRPESIGGFVSYGCIRMFNEDIIDLFDRVSVGTEVVVML